MESLNQNAMKIVDFSKSNSLLNKFVAELRDVNIQKDRLRFRRNVERIGEIMAYEISKDLSYKNEEVRTPLGTTVASIPENKIVLATIFRAGLPFHQGFLNYFDEAENAFVSAYRKYKDEEHFDVHIEYLATPRLDGKTLIIVDPMLATGSSMELSLNALFTKGRPKTIIVAAIIASKQAVDFISRTFPEDKTTLWCAAVDPELNDHAYIVPGLGDAGDLAFGEKE